MSSTDSNSLGNKILRGTAFVSGATVVARLSTFLGNLVVIRLLSVEQVGKMGLIEGWLSLLTMFSLFGVSIALTKYVSEYLYRDPKRTGSIISASFLLNAFIGSITAVVVYFLLTSEVIANDTGFLNILGTTKAILAPYTGWIILLLIALTVRQMIAALIYGLQSFHSFVIANIAVALLGLPVMGLFAWWLGLEGALGARLVLTLVESLILLFSAWGVLRNAGVKLSIDGLAENGKRVLGYGFPTFVGQLIANPIQPFLQSFLAAQPAGLAQLSQITTAGRLTSLASFLPGSMASTLVPILATEWGEDDKTRFSGGILLSLRMLWLGSLPVLVFFIASAPMLLRILYGPAFEAGWPVTIILLIAVLLVSINETGDRSLAAAGYMWLSTGTNLFGSMLFLMLGLVLIPTNLAVGYAIAFLVAYFIYAIVQMGIVRHLFRVQFKRLTILFGWSAFCLLAAIAIAVYLNGPTQLVSGIILALACVVVEWQVMLLPIERNTLRKLGTRMARRLWAVPSCLLTLR